MFYFVYNADKRRSVSYPVVVVQCRLTATSLPTKALHMNRIYLDTSVYGGYFEPEFELWTKVLFDKIQQGSYKVIYSRLTDIELVPAPEKVRRLATSLLEAALEFIDISDQAVELAERYINENVVGRTSRAGCIHIALATLT
jgi:hypothetical protein